jgi:hypothetical protein
MSIWVELLCVVPFLGNLHTWLEPVSISLRNYIELGIKPETGVVSTFSGRVITCGVVL